MKRKTWITGVVVLALVLVFILAARHAKFDFFQSSPNSPTVVHHWTGTTWSSEEIPHTNSSKDQPATQKRD